MTSSRWKVKSRKEKLSIRLLVFGVALGAACLFSLQKDDDIQAGAFRQITLPQAVPGRKWRNLVEDYPQWLNEIPIDSVDDFREVCGQNASFCVNTTSGCQYPEEYPLTCCDDDWNCLTLHGEHVCQYGDLCVSHLVPGTGGAECLKHWETSGGLVLYIFFLLYCFIGLAIVCDDYFVPSLEKISEGLSLSEDVAGATFMAAGSSAPELFVSLADNVISNPPRSVGIGTVIGSAIFNILVIIGLSALLAGQALSLNWRPFARDATFYLISIILLIAVVNDGVIRWWEGLVLLLIYVLYVSFMTVNERFFIWLDGVLGLSKEKIADTEILEKKAQANQNVSFEQETSKGNNPPRLNGLSAAEIEETEEQPISELMLTNNSTQELVNAARAVVEDGLGNGNRDSKSNSSVRHTVETSRPTLVVEAAAEAIKVSKKHGSESNLMQASQSRYTPPVRQASSKNPLHMSKYRGGWNALRREGSQAIKLQDVAQAVLRANNATKVWMQNANDVGQENGFNPSSSSSVSTNNETENDQSPPFNADSTEPCEQDEELGPYFECLYWPVQMEAEEMGKSASGKDEPVKSRSYCSRALGDWSVMWKARLWYMVSLPMNLCFRFTIPDCNYDVFCEDKEGKEENRKIGYSLTFFFCIVWIAILSHFLVFFAAKFGCIVGLSPAVMGLTILAAGTSVPDALSSILVAKNGQGDMAVANSIGSNVFDILIGLGFPWMLAGLIYDTPSIVGVEELWIGIGFLFGVLACLIIILLVSKWVLRQCVGGILLTLYAIYVVFELFLRPLVK